MYIKLDILQKAPSTFTPDDKNAQQPESDVTGQPLINAGFGKHFHKICCLAEKIFVVDLRWY